MSVQAEIYYPESPAERLMIQMIWKVQEQGLPARAEKILPKGTAEIIFNLSHNIHCHKSDDPNKLDIPNCFINGINLTPYKIIKPGHHCFLGIQLHLFALRSLFEIPAVEFSDRITDAELICTELKELYYQISDSNDFNEQVRACLQWLKKKIYHSYYRHPDERITALFADEAVLYVSTRHLSRKYNLCERQLRRIAVEWFGLCPSDFIIYKKYLRSLILLHQKGQSLTGVAYDAGFYDQAHFIREFRSFTGYTPGEYRKIMSLQPGHIFFAGI
ncbi:MAG: AraC family transcriptional regulator [Sphingobacteriales bacterium]|nr:AraC family transcriptional regulator [Sphingobacteriales bacterium]